MFAKLEYFYEFCKYLDTFSNFVVKKMKLIFYGLPHFGTSALGNYLFRLMSSNRLDSLVMPYLHARPCAGTASGYGKEQQRCF